MKDITLFTVVVILSINLAFLIFALISGWIYIKTNDGREKKSRFIVFQFYFLAILTLILIPILIIDFSSNQIPKSPPYIFAFGSLFIYSMILSLLTVINISLFIANILINKTCEKSRTSHLS